MMAVKVCKLVRVLSTSVTGSRLSRDGCGDGRFTSAKAHISVCELYDHFKANFWISAHAKVFFR